MPLLEVEGIVKRFGGLTAVDGVDFHVDEGEIVGLIGPNGAGKTTIFNMVMGALAPDDGEIVYDGEPITDLPTYGRVNRGLARTYQIPKPFPEFSVVENIRGCMQPNGLHVARTRGAFREEAAEIADLVELGDRADRSPMELTPGELRRLEIGKALANDPRLVLLDEVFAGITHEEATRLADLVDRLRNENGVSFLVVDHVMAVLMPLVDRGIVINFGEKVTEGTPEEISQDERVREVYLGGEAVA